MHHDDWQLWGHSMGMFFWLILLIVLVVFASMWIKGKGQNQSSNPSSESPVDIAKKRLAKGEISQEEFEKIKSKIGS